MLMFLLEEWNDGGGHSQIVIRRPILIVWSAATWTYGAANLTAHEIVEEVREEARYFSSEKNP